MKRDTYIFTKKRPKKTLDIAMILCGSMAVIFTITMVVVFCIYQSVPDSLVVAVFGAIFGESSCCALITRAKLKRGAEDDSNFG